MNFFEFYNNIEKRLFDSITSLWATGEKDTQQYFKAILNEEKLLAEPVFQTTFPWEAGHTTFGELGELFDRDFIQALDKKANGEYQFPKDRTPYKHQIESWKQLLDNKKSIAVTTGTGSGKTECFMLPVLHDIYRNCKGSTGVNALFLYPLNALIGSQQKRVHTWAKSLGGINYAVYNGKTPEKEDYNEQQKAFPEILSREIIRKTPPQILFTNPTMLEYVLVRNRDVELLKKSQGTLRWILLDEAHTLTGSKATEMALLIRRVVDAFGVSVKDVRFAITSATVGNDGDEVLSEFVSKLCGIELSQVEIIKGRRIATELPKPTKTGATFDKLKSLKNEERISFYEVHQLRNIILEKDALMLGDIGNDFGINKENIAEGLKLVDLLAETKFNGDSIFPVRGHFFARSIGGAYVCTNSDCKKHGEIKPKDAIGSITTIAGNECTECSSPMLELAACRSCGNQLLYGQKYSSNGKDYFRMKTTVSHDAFQIDTNEEDDENDNHSINANTLQVARSLPGKKYVEKDCLPVGFSSNGELLDEGKYIQAIKDGYSICPHCGSSNVNPMYYRLSSAFQNRVLADLLLEQTPEDKKKTASMLWDGHKYLSFADSRQGTAKISALINIDNEQKWLKSEVFHSLSNKGNGQTDNEFDSADDAEIKMAIAAIEEELKTCLPILKANKEKQLQELKNALSGEREFDYSNTRMSWNDLFNSLKNKSDLKILFKNIGGSRNSTRSSEDYLFALFFDAFSRRVPRERSLENLGLVKIVYPDLEKAEYPEVASILNIDKQEWQSLLKISVDYIIRYYFHYQVDASLYSLATSKTFSNKIYPSNCDISGVKKWPAFNSKNPIQSRLVLLICAGLDYPLYEEIDTTIEDDINTLLDSIWKVMVQRILSPDGDGYKLSLKDKIAFELPDELWLCPVKKRIIDAQFKGYSPWISGRLEPENTEHFKLGQSFSFPVFPYSFNKNVNGNTDRERTKGWIEKECSYLKDLGVWNDIHESVYLNKPVFLAGEHSAQRSDTNLKRLEKQFEDGEVNVLSCSTTMEMGVDIGGISVVVMNNVPPKPANYLQRAGRAGRRAESKSLSLTFCAPSPIGANAMSKPMWALEHKIAPPMLTFNSPIVAERHINAFLFGKFVQENAGLSIKTSIEEFFYNDRVDKAFSRWMLDLKGLNYKQALKILVVGTPLETYTIQTLNDMVYKNFETVVDYVTSLYSSYAEKLLRLEKDFGVKSPAYKAVNYQFSHFKNQNVLSFLATEGFIPSAGMPTGIVDFEITTIEDIKQSNKSKVIKDKPSYHITRALSEYAPGNSVIIGGLEYKSAGIMMKTQWGSSARLALQSCTNCGFQRIITVNDHLADKCPHCANDTLRGMRIIGESQRAKFTELIEPVGFAVDLMIEPTRNISQTNHVNYVEPLLLGGQKWTEGSNAIYEMRDSMENAEILYYNNGNGEGYCVCLDCGRTALRREHLDNHTRLRGGKDEDTGSICSGNNNPSSIRSNVILGGRFQTDFCEIKFKTLQGTYANDDQLLWSLGVVLTKSLANYLGVEHQELSFGIKNYETYKTVFIFDNAKGGAGYAPKFLIWTKEVFKIALDSLDCDCQSACTKCLIDRESQWHTSNLDRYKAIDWLKLALNQKIPDDVNESKVGLETVFGTVKDDIYRVLEREKITSIYFYANNKVADWDLEQCSAINSFVKRSNCSDILLNFVFDEALKDLEDTRNLITAIQFNSKFKFHICQESFNVIKPVCQLVLNDGEIITYYARDFENTISESWGSTTDGNVYRIANDNLIGMKPYQVDLSTKDKPDIFLLELDCQKEIKSNEVARVFLNEINQKIDLVALLRGQKFNVTYSDRYIQSPFACLLLTQFLEKLKSDLKVTFNTIELILGTFSGNNYSPSKIFHNYETSYNRNEELIRIMKYILECDLKICSEYPAHNRYLELKSEDFIVTIRPDGGLAFGWDCVRSEYYNGLTGDERISIRKKDDKPLLFIVNVEYLKLK